MPKTMYLVTNREMFATGRDYPTWQDQMLIPFGTLDQVIEHLVAVCEREVRRNNMEAALVNAQYKALIDSGVPARTLVDLGARMKALRHPAAEAHNWYVWKLVDGAEYAELLWPGDGELPAPEMWPWTAGVDEFLSGEQS